MQERASLLVGTHLSTADDLDQPDHRSTDKERWSDGNDERCQKTQHQIIAWGRKPNSRGSA